MKQFPKSFSAIFITIFVVTLSFGSGLPVKAATSATFNIADGYSVLAGSIVTNSGATTMNRSLGISPSIGVAPHYSGFPPGLVNAPGTIHDADAQAALVQAENTAAFGYIDQGCNTTYPGTQDLVGMNLVPGVYCANAFELSGTLTLNGTASDVWIFKSASTLVTSGTANIVGGNQCNIWWRVVSSATLGVGTILTGNILASTAVSIGTGATLNGRVFTQTAAITLDADTINTISCLAAPTPTPTPTVRPTLVVTSGNEKDYQSVALNAGILVIAGSIAITTLVSLTKRKNKAI